MWIESRVGAMAMMVVMFGSVIGAEAQQCRRVPLPANILLLHDIEEDVQVIYDRSPSFRAQCDRIAEAEHLRVTVRIDPAIPSRSRAFTILQRRGRDLSAEVHLPPSADHSELLAHEFEHILEHVEGLDLRTLSRVKQSGVYELEFAVFETERAKAAGLTVKADTRLSNSPAAD